MFPIKKKEASIDLQDFWHMHIYIYIYSFAVKKLYFFQYLGFFYFFFNFVGQLDLNKRLFNMEW